MAHGPPMALAVEGDKGGVVVVALDATRDRTMHELRLTVDGIRVRGDILKAGNTLLVLGVLHSILNPMGYLTKACTDSFGGTSARAIEEEVSKKVEMYESMLLQSSEQCEAEGVSMKVKIIAAHPTRKVILQEVISCNAVWLVLDRHLRRDEKFYENYVPCKVAIIQDSLSVDVLRQVHIKALLSEVPEQKPLFSLGKSVQPNSHVQEGGHDKQSIISFGSYSASMSSGVSDEIDKSSFMPSSFSRSSDWSMSSHHEAGSSQQGKPGMHFEREYRSLNSSQIVPRQQHKASQSGSSEEPILCAGCNLRSVLYLKDSMKINLTEIQAATSDFSRENFLGEGGFGHVYKGQLKDGQEIAAKVRKEASSQGYSEFFSEVHILSFARHRNIVMLLGYCCKENYNILVYEYICNKSLEWHLFSKSATTLEWHKRRAIAIGTAKGLRFLHEECRGGPIIHRDMRPSNILLTHDFVPMLGDFGLARWKSNNDSFHTRIIGTSGYLAPEYAENGIVSVRTDVYAYGVVLFQLISGCKAADLKKEGNQHLLQWALPLVERLALHELIDRRIEDSYDTYELYHLARAAYLCVRRNPEERPSMGEVVRLLEGENEYFRELAQQFIPHYTG